MRLDWYGDVTSRVEILDCTFSVLIVDLSPEIRGAQLQRLIAAGTRALDGAMALGSGPALFRGLVVECVYQGKRGMSLQSLDDFYRNIAVKFPRRRLESETVRL